MKVHFAGLETSNFITFCRAMGVNYGLYSAFIPCQKKILKKNFSVNDLKIPQMLTENFRHVIQDSGLFTLLFGSQKANATKETVFAWYDALIEYTISHQCNDITCVEIDAQSIIGVDETWKMRERMRKDLPNNRIINVFHKIDGIKGLDRLIEFSDYIAIGSRDTENAEQNLSFVRYIKKKKPQIDIHLLGCTDSESLRKCKYLCTSSDSTSWKSPARFGCIDRYHISELDINKCKKAFGESYDVVKSRTSEEYANAYCTAIELCKRDYEKNAGNQDYTKTFNF